MNRLSVCKSLLISVLSCCSLCSTPASGQLVNEDRTILPTELGPVGGSFGRKVAIDNGVLAVAAGTPHRQPEYGSAHLFDAATQTEILRLIPNDDYYYSGFGASIDIDDGIVAVGAVTLILTDPDDPTRNYNDGSVYLFDATTGEQVRKFTQPGNDVRGIFGYSVALKDGILAVGAPFCEVNHNNCVAHSSQQSFGGYVYLYDVNTGAQLRRLSSNSGQTEDLFGVSISMDNGRLAVGAPADANGGALYVYSVANGVQIRKYHPQDIDSGYRFGFSVSSSGDRVAVGAPGSDHNDDDFVYVYNTVTEAEVKIANPDQPIGSDGGLIFGGAVAFDNDIVGVVAGGIAGRVYMFNATTGLFATELTEASGTSVAIEGLYTAVGAHASVVGQNSSAYLFFTFAGTKIGSVVPEEEDLAFENFGYTTAAGEGVIVISSNQNDIRGENAGSAYIFDASNGSRLATYLPDGGSDNANFGYSLDYDNAIVAVGARDDITNGATGGSVYLFGAFTGQRLRKIVPADAQPSDFFGASVGLDTGFNGGVLAVGASLDDDQGTTAGAVYLFNPFTGVQLNKIYADDAAAGDAFGNVLAIDDGIVAIGASLDDDLGVSSGAAYLFDAGTGGQLFKLLPDDGVAGDHFGSSIAIHNGIVAVGAWQRDDLGDSSGAVYIFDAATGNQLHKFLPDDGEADDRFGFSVSISNGVVLIGANRDDINGASSGSAYIFGVTSGNQLYKLSPVVGNAQDLFGRSVSIHNKTIGIGAIGNDDLSFSAGIAYSFSVPSDICPADFTDDLILNFFDISAFLTAFSANDPIADLSGDGSFDFFDVSAFLAAFSAGCP